jgi:hypothetical protein
VRKSAPYLKKNGIRKVATIVYVEENGCAYLPHSKKIDPALFTT